MKASAMQAQRLLSWHQNTGTTIGIHTGVPTIKQLQHATGKPSAAVGDSPPYRIQRNGLSQTDNNQSLPRLYFGRLPFQLPPSQ